MSWIPTALVTGMQSLFSGSSGLRGTRAVSAMEDIREAMLEGLGVSGAIAASKLELKVTYAIDLHDLWYLRGDVMAAIAAIDGEAIARQKVAHISEMFAGLLPKSLTSRPSRLSA